MPSQKENSEQTSKFEVSSGCDPEFQRQDWQREKYDGER
jgi:hypothetical protein